MLYDVIIYDFSNNFDNARIIVADSGRLEMTADKQHLYLHLYSGEMFENLKAQSMSRRMFLTVVSLSGKSIRLFSSTQILIWLMPAS